jgi:tetratricopeptide (TPR) repeat protein
MRGDRTAADHAFERALSILAGQNASQRLMECHVAYAAILEGRGNLEAALEHTSKALRVARPQLQTRRSAILPVSAVALRGR